jgi:GTP-binding protein HflX
MQNIIEKCIVCGVFLGTGKLEDSDFLSLEELKGLCEAAGSEVVGEVFQNREAYNTRTIIGKGKLEEIKNAIMLLDANLVVFDCELSGSHTRNLEDELGVRVIDRSRLILDIFAQRATTKEGKCQVELAQLTYNLPRLSGIGKSLSKLGGGIGTRGPGESQLETDKRHIRERINNLKHELKEISKNRETQRKQRMKNNIVNISLVGYTNAGKSSILNALTGSSQFVCNMLFATLDPLSKKINLVDGREAVITDTVGFIRKLPHHLVEAFKSTLEVVVYSDLILHIVDVNDDNIEMQIKTVEALLKDLKANEKQTLIIFNKADKVDITKINLPKNGILVSAITGYNIDLLEKKIAEITTTTEIEKNLKISYEKTNIISKIYDNLKVINIEYADNYQEVTVYGKKEIIKQYEKLL